MLCSSCFHWKQKTGNCGRTLNDRANGSYESEYTNVQIYEEGKGNGQWLKSIEFMLPIIEKEFTLSLDNDAQNETVVLLDKKW